MKTNYWKSIAGLSLLALSLAATGCNLQPVHSAPDRSPTTTQSTTKDTRPQVESQDQTFAKKLIGTWESQKITDNIKYELQESFYPAKQFNGKATVTNADGESVYISYSGTWEIKDGYLYYKITSSNVPNLLPVGNLNANKIVNIGDKDYVYIDEQGNQQVDRRVS